MANMVEDEKRRCDRASDAVRSECYDGIRMCMSKQLNLYYMQHPEWLLDARSRAKLEMMGRVLACIMSHLDQYEFCKKG